MAAFLICTPAHLKVGVRFIKWMTPKKVARDRHQAVLRAWNGDMARRQRQAKGTHTPESAQNLRSGFSLPLQAT